MQQLNLFAAPPAATEPIWTTLDQTQQATVVTKLSELIAKTVALADQETHNE